VNSTAPVTPFNHSEARPEAVRRKADPETEMRVLFYTSRYHPNMQGYVHGLLNAGHTVAMIANKTWQDEYHDPRLMYWRIRTSRFNVAGLSRNSVKRRRYLIPDMRFVNRIFDDVAPDVVLLPYISVTVFFFNALCRIKKIPTVLYSDRSPLPTRTHRIRYKALAALGLVPKHYFVSAVGGHLNHLLPGEICLPYTISPDPRADGRSYRTSHPIRILCVGKLVESRKNNAMLVRALAPDLLAGRARLTIVGLLRAENDVYRDLRKEISRQGVDDAVTINPDLPRSACLDAYLDHDLFVLPSTREAAGYAILEAQAAGLPVICSDTAGLSVTIEGGHNGLTFRDNDPTDLHAKITHFLDSPPEIPRIGQNAFHRVRDTYSPEGFVRRFTECLHAWFGDRIATSPQRESDERAEQPVAGHGNG
jgi:glycosyltransferase involved in cell wall biosynthesis